jgi:hypothetical protein
MANITITASGVLPTTTTTTDSGIAGETVTAGAPLYQKSSDSNYLWQCDADLSQEAANCKGIALHGATRGQPIRYATGGDLTLPTMVQGVVYCPSATAGAICPYNDVDTGTTLYATILGVASSTTNLKLAIMPSGVINQ